VVLIRCWIFFDNDRVGAERRQSNDRMLIESFIVAIAEI